MTMANRLLWAPRPSWLFRYTHSRVRPLDIGDEAAEDVLRHYGVQPIGRYRNLPMGWRNHSVIVNTLAGRKILKQYRRGWPLGSVLCEHSVLSHLAALNVPAPRLASTRDGKTMVVRPDGIYALCDFVDGTVLSSAFIPRSLRRALISLTGESLARIHRHLKGFTPQGSHHLGFQSYLGDRLPSLSSLKERLSNSEEKSHSLPSGCAREHAESLIRSSSYIWEELCRLDEELRTEDIPRTIIHGDYGFHNVVFHGPSALTVLDFELARLEWRLTDIVLALPRYQPPSQPFNYRGMKEFLSGYEREYPLTGDEWRLLPHVWAYQHMLIAVQSWNSYFEVAPEERRLVRARDALAAASRSRQVAEALRNGR